MPTTDDAEDLREKLRQAEQDIERMAAEDVIAQRDQLRARRRERGPRDRGPRVRDNVISCRLDGTTLDAVDTLVEAGVRTTRADAATWLIQVGLEANRELLKELADTVTQIRRLRQDAASKAQRHAGEELQQPPPTKELPT
jgi:hypothetical protein